jgi:hypothetical protein
MMKSLLARLKEPSTHAALSALFLAFGLINPAQQAALSVAIPAIIQTAGFVIGAVHGVAGILLKEKAI